MVECRPDPGCPDPNPGTFLLTHLILKWYRKQFSLSLMFQVSLERSHPSSYLGMSYPVKPSTSLRRQWEYAKDW